MGFIEPSFGLVSLPASLTSNQHLHSFLKLLKSQGVNKRIYAAVEESHGHCELIPCPAKVQRSTEVELQECELIGCPTNHIDTEQDAKSYGDVPGGVDNLGGASVGDFCRRAVCTRWIKCRLLFSAQGHLLLLHLAKDLVVDVCHDEDGEDELPNERMVPRAAPAANVQDS